MRGIPLASSAASLNLIRRPHQLRRHLPATFAVFQGKQWQLSHVPAIAPKTHILSNFRLMAMASGENAEKIDVPASVPVRVAHELLLAGHRYLDVRTPEEFSAGHPVGAINVPYMFKAGDGMQKNPNFLEEVSKHFGKDVEIIVGCQSGRRSLLAAADLSLAGFTGVTDIAGGYSSWRQNGLPTE